jgi:hypothetical protein
MRSGDRGNSRAPILAWPHETAKASSWRPSLGHWTVVSAGPSDYGAGIAVAPSGTGECGQPPAVSPAGYVSRHSGANVKWELVEEGSPHTMLAVKLHKRKHPNLGKGSFLVPIRTWQSGRIQIRKWISVLNHHNRGGRNDCVRYLTLVKIPDHHPVFLGLDWSIKLIQRVEFTELGQIDAAIKERLGLAPAGESGPLIMQNFIVPEPTPGAPMAELPELILGEELPRRFIKWTKDVQLLYGTAKQRECEDDSYA